MKPGAATVFCPDRAIGLGPASRLVAAMSGGDDLVVVWVSDEGDYLPLAADDDGEEVENVPANDAHVERGQIREGRVIPREENLLTSMVLKCKLRFEDYRIDAPSHAAEPLHGQNRALTKPVEGGRVQNGAIRASIDEERSLDPSSIGG